MDMAFINEWASNYCPLKGLIFDNGNCFTEESFRDVWRILNMQELNILHSLTTISHPQTNGQLERHICILEEAIRSYFNVYPTGWDLYTLSLTYA